MISSLLLTTVACLSVSAEAAPADLSVGDPAPKIETKEFVKGEPVKEFAKGKVYVVEFWATWCGPCRESIPHLTELQKKYKDIEFIGVSIDEDDTLVKPFVEKMGDKMDYHVAIDARDGKATRMNQTWLDASGQDGIPVSYVVNGDGKIAWIGDPRELEDPLKQIISGKWDLAAQAAEYKTAMATQKFDRDAEKRLDKLLNRKDFVEALNLCDEVVQKKSRLAPQIGPLRLSLMVQLHKAGAQIAAVGKDLVDQGDKTPESELLVLKAIVSPLEVLDPESDAKFDPSVRLVPAVATFVAAEADKIDAAIKAELTRKNAADKPAADKPAADEYSNVGENGFQLADHKEMLAQAYLACGDKEKAIAKYDDASAALNSAIRVAREELKDIREMKKAFTGEAADSKATDDNSAADPTGKPIVVRKKKVEP